MFKLSRDELNRRRAAKPIQTTEEMFEALGFDDLVEPGVKVELSTAFHDVFERYARITNPEDGGEKVFAFDAHRLVESLCRMWAELYGTVATSREEVLRDKALLEEEVRKLSEAEEKHVKKLAGELEVCQGKLQAVQHSYMERGTAIEKLEALVAALSVKPSNVTNPHSSAKTDPHQLGHLSS